MNYGLRLGDRRRLEDRRGEGGGLDYHLNLLPSTLGSWSGKTEIGLRFVSHIFPSMQSFAKLLKYICMYIQ